MSRISRIFRRRKGETKQAQANQSTETVSELEKLAGDDKTTYEALTQSMFLDPRKIETPVKQAVENAKKSEKDGDKAKAGMWYEVAGGLSIYEGNVKKVVEFYSEAHRILGREYPILKNPEKAVALAQEYYKKYLVA